MKKSSSKNSFGIMRNAKTLATSAVLTACCIVLASLAKSIFGSGPIRFTVENLPILLGSFLYGPFIGAAIAVASDLLSCLLFGMAPLPFITLGAASIGLASGFLYRFCLKKLSETPKIFISVAVSHIIGSMAIKTAQLYLFYGMIALYRLPLYVVISIVESLILCLILKNQGFVKQLRSK